MHYVEYLPPVQLEDLVSGEPLRQMKDGITCVIAPRHMDEVVIGVWLQDTALNKDMKGIGIAVEIGQAFKKARAQRSAFVSLEDEQWERLKAVIESPSNPAWGVDPVVAQQYLPLARAIINAKTDPPESRNELPQ